MPPNLTIDDPRQRAFLDRLKSDPGNATEVIEAPLEDFKARLWDALGRAKAATSTRDVTARRSVYVVCDQPDLEAARAVCDVLFLQGFEVLMPIFDADTAKARQHHEENLGTCDAVLLYYGSSSEVWLRRQLRDIQKVAGFGRAAPAPTTGVYLGPPNSPEKDRFRTHEAIVMTGLHRAPEIALEPFIAALK